MPANERTRDDWQRGRDVRGKFSVSVSEEYSVFCEGSEELFIVGQIVPILQITEKIKGEGRYHVWNGRTFCGAIAERITCMR